IAGTSSGIENFTTLEPFPDAVIAANETLAAVGSALSAVCEASPGGVAGLPPNETCGLGVLHPLRSTAARTNTRRAGGMIRTLLAWSRHGKRPRRSSLPAQPGSSATRGAWAGVTLAGRA